MIEVVRSRKDNGVATSRRQYSGDEERLIASSRNGDAISVDARTIDR
jgi:hypothetical protein